MSTESTDTCNHCGAPRAAGYAACKFCKTPFVKDTQTGAIPCPRCNTLNEIGAQKCVQCQTWIVVQCVFCHSLSPHNKPACEKCGEAFAGAPQRFAERQSQQRVQQGLNIAGQVGNVAATVLGAAAVAGVFSGGSHHHSHGHSGGYGHGHGHGYGGGEYDHGGTGAGIEQGGSGGGFLDSVFGGGESQSQGTGAGIEQSGSGGSGGGFFDSLFGGSSDSGSGSSDSGSSDSGSFWDSSDDSGSSDSGDSGGFWDSDD